MPYIIAGAAIWSIGSTPEIALARYVADTGDDSLTLDNISRNPRSGQTYIAPASQELIESVEVKGGDIAWTHDADGVAVLPSCQ